MSEDIAFAGAAEQARMLRDGEASSRELTEMYLDRIRRIDPQLNAYRDVWDESALAAADEADRKIAAGEKAPMLGVPIAIKDTVDVKGDVTMFGTSAFDEPAAQDSTLVARLRDAGSVILGKTNLPELAIHGFTESKTNGATRNPWNTGRTPGGSSGGAGAAVAAGLAAIGHASDGAGSIRYPASNCGLFGLKPQRNRVPIDTEHWHGLSVNGCVSRTVADTALFLDSVTSGTAHSANAPPAPERSFSESAASEPGKLRIAVTLTAPKALLPPLLGGESKLMVERMAETLASLGHAVDWHDPDWGNVGNQFAARFSGGIGEDVAEVPHRDRLESLTRGYGRIAKVGAPKWAIRRAVRLEAQDRDRINALFDDYDVLLSPMTAGPPVEIGRWHNKRAISAELGQSRYYPYGIAWNHTGQPAASVPAGLSTEGLPLAVQIVAPPNGEGTLLSLASQLEAETGWPDRRPPVG